MQIESALLNMEADISNAEAVKEMVIMQLFEDGILTPQQRDVYLQDWQVIIFKKGWFRRWFDKYGNGKDSQWAYQLVRFSDDGAKI